MKSIYKRLGDYIQLVSGRNSELNDIPLMGLSIQKKFIPSIANTIGTDMSTYRIIENNQFAYGPVTSRNGDKITIAHFTEHEKGLISQAYIPFEVKDKNELDPEYLMMWFRRPEFDRYARFKSHGSAREIFDWEEMCNVTLPVPSIEKQREIVKEYNTIQNRIALNHQLIQKLEETAQAIYKRWFVEFEFPDENGNPFLTSGGKMVWCEELGKEIPKGWVFGKLDDLKLDISDGNYSSKYPSSTDFISEGVPFIRGTDFDNKVVSSRNLYFISEVQHRILKKGHTKKGDILLSTRGEIGKIAFITNEFINCNINAQLVRINGGTKYSTFYLGCIFESSDYKEELLSSTTGSALQQLPRKNLSATRLLIPHISIIQDFTRRYESIHANYILRNNQNQKLTELKALLLSRLATVE
jgi:type I restriction enzyme S subunit